MPKTVTELFRSFLSSASRKIFNTVESAFSHCVRLNTEKSLTSSIARIKLQLVHWEKKNFFVIGEKLEIYNLLAITTIGEI